MNLDPSSFQSPGRLFEVDLGTVPTDIFAQVWSLRVADGLGKSEVIEQFGTGPVDLEFRRDGFVGSSIDWSDIDELAFRQEGSAAGTAP
jgi:hypothetical protein